MLKNGADATPVIMDVSIPQRFGGGCIERKEKPAGNEIPGRLFFPTQRRHKF
jgi:hypothetical protein